MMKGKDTSSVAPLDTVGLTTPAGANAFARASVLKQRSASVTGRQLEALQTGDVDSMRKFVAEEAIDAITNLNEAPTNFHQATVHILLAADRNVFSTKQRYLYLLFSYLFVMLQIVSIAALFAAMLRPKCDDRVQSMCPLGMACVSEYNSCVRCETLYWWKWDQEELDAMGAIKNHTFENRDDWEWMCNQFYKDKFFFDDMTPEGHVHKNLVRYCTSCSYMDSDTGDSRFLHYFQLANSHVTLMTLFEWMILALAAVVTALTLSSELRDITFTEISQRKAMLAAYDKNGSGVVGYSEFFAAMKAGDLTYFFLYTLVFLRQFVCLPLLLATIPLLVLTQGANAVGICMNTVAVLFLLDLDNLVYEYGINEKTKTYLEVNAHIQLEDADAESLSVAKSTYMGLIPCTVLVAVVGGKSEILVAPLICIIALMAGNLIERLFLLYFEKAGAFRVVKAIFEFIFLKAVPSLLFIVVFVGGAM